MTDDDILDDLFHGCALSAFLEQAQAQQDWPDLESTRRRAYTLYEETLAERNAAKRAGFSIPRATDRVPSPEPHSHDNRQLPGLNAG